ncbi:hypothetical protein JCM24511_03155 [Saitozyma sp. JCM 24511]|nr:hypothetical protein JCM24511_03155 [Saitozyma sp. JCM 24511]
MSALSGSLLEIHAHFFEALRDGHSLDRVAADFADVRERFEACRWEGSLNHDVLAQAWAVASNIARIGAAVQDLSQRSDQSLEDMVRQIGHLTVESTHGPSSKRPRLKHGDSQPSIQQNATMQSGADAIRLWFLHHLADPYPTPLQKRNLSTSTNIPVPRLEAHLTNWRRRAGWSAILHKRCEGKKDLMAVLVTRVLSGEEKDPGIIKEVEGVQKYLRKEEEGRVGEWVYQLAELAKKAQAPTDTTDTADDEQDAGDASPPLPASSDASPSSTSTSDRSDLLLRTPRSSDSSSPSSSLDSSSPPVPARQIIHPPPGDTAYSHRTLSTASSFSSLSASSAIVRATPRSTSTNSNASSTSATSGISSVSAASVALGSNIDAVPIGANLRRRTSSVRSTAEEAVEYLAEAPTDGNFSFTPFSFFPSPTSTTSTAHAYPMANEYAAMQGYQPVYYVPAIPAHADPNVQLHPGIKRPADAETPAAGSRSKDAKYHQHTPSGDEYAPWTFNHPLGPPTGFSLGTYSPSSSTPSKRSAGQVSQPVDYPAPDVASTFAIQEYPVAYSTAMWSTTADLPMLPHMVSMGPVAGTVVDGAEGGRASKAWALPHEHNFELSFPDWA